MDVKRYSSTYSSYGSLDTCPGSYLDIIHRTYKNSHATFPLWYYDGDTNYPFYEYFWAPIVLSWFTNFDIYMDLKEDAVFMPSKSTLAYTGSNSSWREDLGCRDLVCTGETPFDSYYTPPENQAHVAVHAESVDWLLQELQGIEMDPVYSCYENTSTIINGDNRICYNQTKTYTLSNECNGSVTWSKSSNLQILSSDNSQVTVKSINSYTGSAWIKATFSNGQSTTKQIVGKPALTYEAEGQGHIVDIQLISQGLNFPQQGITSITWSQTGGTGNLYASNNSFSAIAIGSHSGGWYVDGIVEVSNSCGITELSFHVVSTSSGDPCDPPYQQSIVLIPISLNKYQVIDPCDPENPQFVDVSELYDLYGVKLQNIEPQQDIIDVENTGSSGEIRIIKVESNGKVATKRVIVD